MSPTEKQKNNFWRKVVKNKDCWIWQGCTNIGGYGKLTIAKKQILAHRFSYMLTFGVIPDGVLVLHDPCDNPPCVNHSHLKLGNCLDNIQDKIDRKRQASKLTEYQVKDIVKLLTDSILTYEEIANQFSVTIGDISSIANGRIWGHLGITPSEEFILNRKNLSRINENNCDVRASLTLEEVDEIKSLYSIGNISQKKLGAKFGISGPQVSRIISGKRWGHLVSSPLKDPR